MKKPKRKPKARPLTLVGWFADPDRGVGWVREDNACRAGIVWLTAGPNRVAQAAIVHRDSRGRWFCGGLLGNTAAVKGQPGEATTWMRWFLPPGVHPKTVARDLRRGHDWYGVPTVRKTKQAKR